MTAAHPLILISYKNANWGDLVEYISVDTGRTVKGHVMTTHENGSYTTVLPSQAEPILHADGSPVMGTARIEAGRYGDKLVIEQA